MRIVVNGAFRPQRVTGQQRYAHEIADRLVAAGAVEERPSGFWARSSLRTWIWCLVVLPWRTRRDVLVSLTARAPVVHPGHVLAVHDLFVVTNPEWYSRRYVVTHAPLLRHQLRAAAGLVAVSAPVATQTAALLERLEPIDLAPNAPSSLFTTACSRPELLTRFGIRADEFLLVIGSTEPRKNLVRLSEAWRSTPEAVRLRCPLLVVGGDAAIYADGRADWPSGTVATGYLPDEQLAALYRVARGVIFVSLAEGFGLPIVEAAAAGVPRLVLSDIEVFRWIAGESATYVDPRSVDDIACALGEIAAGSPEPSARPRLDTSRFDWSTSAATVMSVARRAAERRTSGSSR